MIENTREESLLILLVFSLGRLYTFLSRVADKWYSCINIKKNVRDDSSYFSTKIKYLVSVNRGKVVFMKLYRCYSCAQ